MFDAAIKALSQMLSPPLRTILWKSIGLSLGFIVVVGIALQRLLTWFAGTGELWIESTLGPGYHTAINVLAWIISIATSFGVVMSTTRSRPSSTCSPSGNRRCWRARAG